MRLKTSKLDNLKNYIETNKFYKLDNYYIEDVFIYMVEADIPSFLKIKYRSVSNRSKKEMRTYKIVDNGEYFKNYYNSEWWRI